MLLFNHLDETVDRTFDAISDTAEQQLSVWQMRGLSNKWWRTSFEFWDDQIAGRAPSLVAQLTVNEIPTFTVS